MSSRDKKPSKSSSSSGRIGGIRTLSDLNRPSGHDSDSDSDAPQEYYTGGEKRQFFSNPSFFFFIAILVIDLDCYRISNWFNCGDMAHYCFSSVIMCLIVRFTRIIVWILIKHLSMNKL